MANVGEHGMDMPPLAAQAGISAAPEKRLNHFVHFVATMERFGNALGTLAFTWATVVLLGGYPTALIGLDFWFSTAIVLLEAMRMFSRSNRPDYQLFFRTRGAFRSFGWKGLILLVIFSDVLACAEIWNLTARTGIPPILLAILATGPFLFPGVARLVCSPVRQAISLWSPMVAILLLAPSTLYKVDDSFKIHIFDLKHSGVKLPLYLVLFAVVLLLTITRLRFPSVIKIVDRPIGSKIVFWRQAILNVCMFAAMTMWVFTFEGFTRISLIMFEIFALAVVSFGNLQIPIAILRIVMALYRLITQHYYSSDEEHVDKANLGDKENLVASLNIFYVMLLGQGILYVVACILEVFSIILRRSLVRRAGFSGPLGMKYVNLYYAYAFDNCMGGAVLSPKKMSLITFAMDSLKSDSPKMRLYGLQMLHNFLKNEPFKTKATLRLTSSTKTVTSLVNMLRWTSEGDMDIRLFAAKVTADLADSLLVVHFPGALRLIASLLDTVYPQKIKDPLMYIGSLEPKQDGPLQQVGGDKESSPMIKWLKQMVTYCLIPREDPPSLGEQNSCILRFWKQITKCWSVPDEEPSTDQDHLPVQGMLILEKLASFDLENCIEISRSAGLISKVIEFTSNKTDMTSITVTHQTLLKSSSLKLLRRLASTKGEFGVTVRQKISEHPFLLSNLAEILDDGRSSQELTKLTAEILRNIAMDANRREEIGKSRVIINRLMHAFLRRDAALSTDSDYLLREIVGQALAILAMGSANNCMIMLAEPEYLFFKELTIMIHGDRCKYVAASILRSLCAHALPELSHSELKDLCYILREVLEEIMDAEGAELEVLVGLSSQICNVIPEEFARELEHGLIMERFVKRLVDALNASVIPTAHSPGIRRVIIEHAIYMMEGNPSCAGYFNKCWMMEALVTVELTPSRAENYRFFSGDTGLMEHNVPISALVARSRELMGGEWLRGISGTA